MKLQQNKLNYLGILPYLTKPTTITSLYKVINSNKENNFTTMVTISKMLKFCEEKKLITSERKGRKKFYFMNEKGRYVIDILRKFELL